MLKRYIVEFGTGVDLHGGDVTKAAKKAVKDAISHCCLCGLDEIHGVKNFNEGMHIKLKIGSPDPDRIDKNEVLGMIPFGKAEIEVVEGGLSFGGLSVPTLGEGSTIVMVNAAITVFIEV
ncbi:MAG: Lin0512 family protein [Clostridiaceae bacterium]